MYVYVQSINGFLLPKFKHWWWPNHRHSKEQPQKAWLSDIAICSHVQIHCACQCIMTLAPKILWPTALLNAWTIMTFPKSSFYHTNHTFLTSINVWMMDFSSINARIKKTSSAQNTILCRKWLLQKLTFHHNEITIFEHSQYNTQRIFGEPPAPSVYIYIYIYIPCGKYLGEHSWAVQATGIDSLLLSPVVWLKSTHSTWNKLYTYQLFTGKNRGSTGSSRFRVVASQTLIVYQYSCLLTVVGPLWRMTYSTTVYVFTDFQLCIWWHYETAIFDTQFKCQEWCRHPWK